MPLYKPKFRKEKLLHLALSMLAILAGGMACRSSKVAPAAKNLAEFYQKYGSDRNGFSSMGATAFGKLEGKEVNLQDSLTLSFDSIKFMNLTVPSDKYTLLFTQSLAPELRGVLLQEGFEEVTPSPQNLALLQLWKKPSLDYKQELVLVQAKSHNFLLLNTKVKPELSPKQLQLILSHIASVKDSSLIEFVDLPPAP